MSALTHSEVGVDMIWGHKLGAQRGLPDLAWAQENDSEMVIKLNNRLLLCLQRFFAQKLSQKVATLTFNAEPGLKLMAIGLRKLVVKTPKTSQFWYLFFF